MDEGIIKELTQRIKELEWEVKHLQELNRIDPHTGEWKNNY